MNWFSLGRWLLRQRVACLVFLVLATGFMAYRATQVKLSYEFTSAIPRTNQKFIDYEAFRQRFGADANLVVVGVKGSQQQRFPGFSAWKTLQQNLKQTPGVEGVLALPQVVQLQTDSSGEKLEAKPIFQDAKDQQTLDSAWTLFNAQPFYRGLLYNPGTQAHLMLVTLNRDSANSKARNALMSRIDSAIGGYQETSMEPVHVSGLPYLRTKVAAMIASEMTWFLIGSLLLTAITMLLFFRSGSATLVSLAVVGMGVVWSMGTMDLLGYKITLLTALIPPLIVVIGIPNCIYFLNKYHSAWKDTGDQREALVTMVGRMGIVTLFCNLAAAIGFAVFAFTSSSLLREFGIVSGINILLLFGISLLFIPAVLSYLAPPKPRHLRYLKSAVMERVVNWLEGVAFRHGGKVVAVTLVCTLLAGAGLLQLKRQSFVVDDLPKQNKLYTDLKWFEENFGGVLPLEIVVDTKKRNGLTKGLATLENMDSLARYLQTLSAFGRPLSLVEGLKFARQGYYDNDTAAYATPTEFDVPVMGRMLQPGQGGGKAQATNLGRMMNGFVDSSRQRARITVNMKDVGSAVLPGLLTQIQQKADSLFGKKATVTLTGSSVTFVEGNRFIISGLAESIVYAFALIALCMLYLFKNGRILLCSLIPNVIPLVITAGVMGWAGIPLKPSTVLVFSVALGISIDVTIRFLVSYRQEGKLMNAPVADVLRASLRSTAISIIYTSLVLVAGFVIFSFSAFQGTRGLGWLTSLTLVVATFTNLLLLPVLMRWLVRR